MAQRCIDSWRRYCPDYEIRAWTEDDFDVNENRYFKEALDAKKWAFASDYARLWVLVKHGGVYMDTDVELVGNLDPFLDNGAFSGFESVDCVPTGLMASEPDHPFMKQLLKEYEKRVFKKPDGSFDLTTNVEEITQACVDAGLRLDGSEQEVAGFRLYPKDYFCPKDHVTGDVNMTHRTVAIHHFDGSWLSPWQRLKKMVKIAIGPSAVSRFRRILGKE